MEFKVEVISKGCFTDEGCRVETFTVRMLEKAMNEFIMSSELNCRETYETEEEWQSYKGRITNKRAEWERAVSKLVLGFEDKITVTQVVSEIFTIVHFVEVPAYLVMDEKDVDGKYHVSSDGWKKLKEQNHSYEFEEFVNAMMTSDYGFSFNMVYITKQKCGHYEMFQNPLNEYYTLESNLKMAEEHARLSKCTQCICNWKG
jgi:hypothetical protein